MTNDAHARPSGEPEDLLYDPDVPTPTHGERARTLAASIGTGALCTITKEPEGFPYGSFVTFALAEGNPVFLISELAEHTKNLRANPRSSLLVAETTQEDPLANSRVTLIGECGILTKGEEYDLARRAYLETHPNAEYYVDYKDFSFWMLGVESLRYIGGYGRMSWVSKEDWFASETDPIAPHAQAIIDHMNNDHAPNLVEYCKAFSKAKDTGAAAVTIVDRYGFEMSAQTGKGPRPIRLAFAQPIETPADARREMVALAERAREILAEP
jgi:hypothetical protein